MTPKKHLKLKKKVMYIGLFSLTLIIFLINLGLHFYQNYKYKQTYEYKLITIGYTKEEATLLLKSFSEEEELKKILDQKKNEKLIQVIQEKYYMKKNLDRYLAYIEKNKDTSINEVVTLVNVHRDSDYYENTIEANLDKGILLNVNKYYYLSEEYIPEELEKISIRYAYAGNNMISEANTAFYDLCKSAEQDGLTLIVNSSYRSYENQVNTYRSIKNAKGEREADKTAARPGHSEHQTGLSVDVFEKNNQSTLTFKDSEAYSWLKENAHNYGFIERYPEGKENITGYNPEAWHWRYVGTEVAKIIHDENITFDEYYAFYVEN